MSRFYNTDPNLNTNALWVKLEQYLQDSNYAIDTKANPPIAFDSAKSNITKVIRFRNKGFKLYFDSELVLKTIYPGLAHLETTMSEGLSDTFHVYLDNDMLCLFKNHDFVISVPKRDYHLLQGKFIMELLCAIYDRKESDWLGTFHGCTIGDGFNSILIAGASGKGKSTLSALLAAKGFELVADDVSPLLSQSTTIYNNPSAISIKAGAFNLLQKYVPSFKDIPSINFNKSKGDLKYIAFPPSKKTNYPCKAIILVNYVPQSIAVLETVSINDILKVLIPESWLSPHPEHAQAILNWLETLEFYKLTYSDTEAVTALIKTRFADYKSHE